MVTGSVDSDVGTCFMASATGVFAGCVGARRQCPACRGAEPALAAYKYCAIDEKEHNYAALTVALDKSHEEFCQVRESFEVGTARAA